MNKPVTGIRKIFIMGSGGHMKIKNNTVFLIVLWLLCLSPIIQSAGPGTITYQGNIATQSGDPPGAGIYDMRVSVPTKNCIRMQKWHIGKDKRT
jgi:hypothetical protein